MEDEIGSTTLIDLNRASIHMKQFLRKMLLFLSCYLKYSIKNLNACSVVWLVCDQNLIPSIGILNGAFCTINSCVGRNAN